MPPVFGGSPGAQGLLEVKERVMSFNRCSWEIQEHEDWEVGPLLKDFCFTWLLNALHFLLFHGSLSGKGWLYPWWGHFCLSGAGGPSLTESWREDLLYWKGKWKIPAHFQVYLILTTGPGSGRFVGLLLDEENEVQRENIANFRSWAF